MKNITLSADQDLIEAARRRASAERPTLNAQFRLWLQAMRSCICLHLDSAAVLNAHWRSPLKQVAAANP